MKYLGRTLTFGLGLLGATILASAVAAVSAKASYLRAFLARLVDFAQLDFGTSRISRLPALHVVATRLPATLELILVGGLIAFIVGAPLGLLLGKNRMRAAALPLELLSATPVFCAALAVLWIAVRVCHWNYLPEPLPWPALAEGGWNALSALRALSLPGLTVGAAGAAAVQLAVRRSESEALEEPFGRNLRLMGLSSSEINWLYVAPQVLAGLLDNLGEIFLTLFSAAAVAEWVFAWPGAAVLLLKSVALHDWNVAALVIFLFVDVVLLMEFCGSLAASALGREYPR